MGLKPVVIVGGVGGGLMVADIFEAINSIKSEWDVVGFINKKPAEGAKIGKYDVLGGLEKIRQFIGKDYYIFYTLHQGVTRKRSRIERSKKFNIPIERTPTAIHPLTFVHPSVKIGRGVSIEPFTVIQPEVVIEDHVRIGSNVTIGHESHLGRYTEINNNVSLGGGVVIKEGSYVGLGAFIREYVVVGRNSIVGMGAVVVKNVEDNIVVVGNPAKKLRRT